MQVKSNSPSPHNVQPKVERVLRWFNQDDELVDEVYLKNVDLTELQRLFAVSEEDPMYDCYLVETQAQEDYLEKRLDLVLDTKTYEYFLESEVMSDS